MRMYRVSRRRLDPQPGGYHNDARPIGKLATPHYWCRSVIDGRHPSWRGWQLQGRDQHGPGSGCRPAGAPRPGSGSPALVMGAPLSATRRAARATRER